MWCMKSVHILVPFMWFLDCYSCMFLLSVFQIEGLKTWPLSIYTNICVCVRGICTFTRRSKPSVTEPFVALNTPRIILDSLWLYCLKFYNFFCSCLCSILIKNRKQSKYISAAPFFRFNIIRQVLGRSTGITHSTNVDGRCVSKKKKSDSECICSRVYSWLCGHKGDFQHYCSAFVQAEWKEKENNVRSERITAPKCME